MDNFEREQRIKIYLEAYGVQDVNKALKEIKTRTTVLTDSTDKLNSKYGSVENAIKDVAEKIGRASCRERV